MARKRKLGDRLFSHRFFDRSLEFLVSLYHLLEIALLAIACVLSLGLFLIYLASRLWFPMLWITVNAYIDGILFALYSIQIPTGMFWIGAALLAYIATVAGGKTLLNGLSEIRRSL